MEPQNNNNNNNNNNAFTRIYVKPMLMVLECKLYRIEKSYCQERNVPTTKLIKNAYSCDRKTHSHIVDISAVRKQYSNPVFQRR